MACDMHEHELAQRARNALLDARSAKAAAAADAILSGAGALPALKRSNSPDLCASSGKSPGTPQQRALKAHPLTARSCSLIRNRPTIKMAKPASQAITPPLLSSRSVTSDEDDEAVSSQASEWELAGHPEATVRVQRVRVRSLQQELSAAQDLIQAKDKQLAAAAKELEELRREKAALLKSRQAQDALVETTKQTALQAREELQAKENLLRDLNRVGFRQLQDRKAADAAAKAKDVRLQRALFDVEKFRKLLEEAKLNKKDTAAQLREEHNWVVTENKKLSRQKSELVMAFKKALKLIDVLKRQKLHLEASHLLQFTEEEFMKAVDLGAAY